ncbi:hypothetical protein VNO80_19293 [Phaseolus coccineus]|uniref:Uncharacterized protein n=1 Tax=Phaseolus coccineus TaxID=3886 RepID=A0AAN9QX69_PHACN
MKERSAKREANLLNAIDALKGKEAEFFKTMDVLQHDMASSFIVGFEAAKDQAAILHPSMDLSEMNPCKTAVDGKIVDGLMDLFKKYDIYRVGPILGFSQVDMYKYDIYRADPILGFGQGDM